MPAKITVIIPTYNKADYISQTIESVFNQTFTNFEILIIDDCSSDSTEVVVQKYLSEHVRYFKHTTNWGPGATFNDGIEKANTDYVTLIASDDILLPNHLSSVVKIFDENPSIEYIIPRLNVINEAGNNLGQVISPPWEDKYILLNHMFYDGNEVPSPGVAYRKKLFKRIKPFNTNLIVTHDYDLNIRAMLNTEIAILPCSTVLYRRFIDKTQNLSANSNWFVNCNTSESKFILNNYLNVPYDEMKKVFPELKNCRPENIIFEFLISVCKNPQPRLYTWAFEKLIEYFEMNNSFFYENKFNFQYRDYINLYKKNAEIIKNTKNFYIYNKLKRIIKKLFGIV